MRWNIWKYSEALEQAAQQCPHPQRYLRNVWTNGHDLLMGLADGFIMILMFP